MTKEKLLNRINNKEFNFLQYKYISGQIGEVEIHQFCVTKEDIEKLYAAREPQTKKRFNKNKTIAYILFAMSALLATWGMGITILDEILAIDWFYQATAILSLIASLALLCFGGYYYMSEPEKKQT